MSENTNGGVSLDNLNDYQNSLLARVSYLDIDMEAYQKLAKEKGGNVTIAELESVLADPDACYIGGSTEIMGPVAGMDKTHAEFLAEIKDAGLGDLEIVGIADDKETSFQAMCFEDSSNNRGMSYRGTDWTNLPSIFNDAKTDVEGYFTSKTPQVNQALDFFEKYSNGNGKNFTYGHSLGGFLCENVFAENHDKIDHAYSYNALHIDQTKLNTQDKINAFNNSEKFDSYVTGGDPVSQLNEPTKFNSSITYIAPSNNVPNNALGNHAIEAGKIDKNGSFVTCSKEQAYADRESIMPEMISDMANTLKDAYQDPKGTFKDMATKTASTAADFVPSVLASRSPHPIVNFFGHIGFAKTLIQKLTPAFQAIGKGLNGVFNSIKNTISFNKNKDNPIENTSSTYVDNDIALETEDPFALETYASPEVCEHAREVSNNPSKFMNNNIDNSNTMDQTIDPDEIEY